MKLAKFTKKELARFLIPSVLGIIIFLLPIPHNGSITIPIGMITDCISRLIAPVSAMLVLILVSISAVISAVTSIFKPKCITENKRLAKFFVSSPVNTALKIIGAVILVMVYTQKGPEQIISEDTGGTMLSLVQVIISWFFAASFLIPLLVDFGIMDYIGTLIKDFTQPLFKLPGRSTVDLLASWLGSNSVGVIITANQYEEGYYTAREAIMIATCFSAVSLPFSMVIAAMLHVDSQFIPFYAIVCITGFLCALIMARIPPLSKYPNTYYAPVGKKRDEDTPEGYGKHQWALQLAVKKAANGPSFLQALNKGIDMFLGIVFQSSPIVVAIGTIACIVATYTPVFEWLSIPFGYFLQLLGVEEAFSAAPASIVGFVDMFLPAILASGITSFKTRFVIGILSIVQIVYITEIGTLILSSKMPIKFMGLLAVFLERTIIALPVIVLFTNLFGIG